MEPYYIEDLVPGYDLEDFADVPWVSRTEAREECFMSPEPRSYTYGSGRGVRTYFSTEMLPVVGKILEQVNIAHRTVFPSLEPAYNVCFLNRYRNERHHLGWHSDDSAKMTHTSPIAVVSFGDAREIWWREKGWKGEIPVNQRQLLEHGSVFFMPPGFQRTHEHRIPKGGEPKGERFSLTFRRFWEW